MWGYRNAYVAIQVTLKVAQDLDPLTYLTTAYSGLIRLRKGVTMGWAGGSALNPKP